MVLRALSWERGWRVPERESHESQAGLYCVPLKERLRIRCTHRRPGEKVKAEKHPGTEDQSIQE